VLWFLRRLVAVVLQGSLRIMQKMDSVLEKIVDEDSIRRAT
jgi:hypothetical protein